MWAIVARLIVRHCPHLADAVMRERSSLETARRKEVMHLLADRVDRRVRPYGKQSAPGCYGKEDDAS